MFSLRPSQLYSPLAITCACCEILESIIPTGIIKFLGIHKLIARQQHSFLEKHNCLHGSAPFYTLPTSHLRSATSGLLSVPRTNSYVVRHWFLCICDLIPVRLELPPGRSSWSRSHPPHFHFTNVLRLLATKNASDRNQQPKEEWAPSNLLTN